MDYVYLGVSLISHVWIEFFWIWFDVDVYCDNRRDIIDDSHEWIRSVQIMKQRDSFIENRVIVALTSHQSFDVHPY